MIDFLKGRIFDITERAVTVMVAGVGYSAFVPDVSKFSKDQDVELFIHWGWSAERGPALYGFATRLERQLFALLLECPKIGPQISLQVLFGISAARCLQMIVEGQESALSCINGIGPKKAKAIINQLQDKVGKIIPAVGSTDQDQGCLDNQMVCESIQALKSMGYIDKEISKALKNVSSQSQTQMDFTEFMRMMLSELSKQRSF